MWFFLTKFKLLTQVFSPRRNQENIMEAWAKFFVIFFGAVGGIIVLIIIAFLICICCIGSAVTYGSRKSTSGRVYRQPVVGAGILPIGKPNTRQQTINSISYPPVQPTYPKTTQSSTFAYLPPSAPVKQESERY